MSFSLSLLPSSYIGVDDETTTLSPMDLIRFTTDEYVPPTVRLVGGSSNTEGRVEILYNGEWGTVCDDNWDTDDAVVVCRQLGLPFTGAAALTKSHFGQGSGPILLDEVNCTGRETKLEQCPSHEWHKHDCGHKEDAGVRCCK